MSVLFDHALTVGSRADYALCDRSRRPVAAAEAKRAGRQPIEAQDPGRHYAERPRVFVRNVAAEPTMLQQSNIRA